MNVNLENNLKVIRKVSKNLADDIKKSSCTWAEIIKSKNGKNNLYINKNNRPAYAYNPENPMKSAKMVGKQKVFFKDTATMIIGMGLGHTAYEILKNKEKGHRVFIIEPTLWMLKMAFSEYDFSKYITDGSLVIATSKNDVVYLSNVLDTLYVIQDWMTITEQYILTCEEYKEIGQFALEIINQLRCNTGTVMGAGHIIAENDIKNLPYVIRHRGVIDLKDLFKGKPAISVNTGPSLAKNIHLLKDVADKVVIIAVAQALRILLAYGIKPDFICTVDYGKVNKEHFNGLFDEKDVNLVCLNRTYAPIIKQWQGTKFIAGTPCPGFEDFTKVLQGKGFLEQGGSVSHMNLGLALHLGCDPILVIGQDFAYSPDLLSHIEQVDAGGQVKIENGMMKWKIKDPRSSIKTGTHPMGGVVMVDGLLGEPVPTNIGLASFILSFERIIEGKENRVIDCTEGGAKKKGSIPMTLEKAISEYLKKPIDKSVIEPLKTIDPNADKLVDESLEVLVKDIENLKNIITHTSAGLATCEDIKTAIKKRKRSKNKDIYTKKIDKLLEVNLKQSQDAHECTLKNNLMGVSIFHASRRINARDLAVSGKNTYKQNKEDLLNIRIKRNETILTAVKDSAEKLLPIYKKTYTILKKYKDTGDLSLLETPIEETINLKDADKYFKVGNWAHPLVDAEKVLKKHSDLEAHEIMKKAWEMRGYAINKAKELYKTEKRQDLIDYNEWGEQSYKLGRAGDFKKALDFLIKAYKLNPDKERARWGLSNTYFRLGNIDKCIEYFEGLVKDFPDVLQYQFELGIVTFEKDLNKGIELITALMAKTGLYDYFFKDLGQLFMESGQTEKAVVAYENYISKYPANYEIYKTLATLYKKLGNIKQSDKMDKIYKEMMGKV